MVPSVIFGDAPPWKLGRVGEEETISGRRSCSVAEDLVNTSRLSGWSIFVDRYRWCDQYRGPSMNDKDHFKLVTGYKDSLSNTLTMVAGNTQPVPLSSKLEDSWRVIRICCFSKAVHCCLLFLCDRSDVADCPALYIYTTTKISNCKTAAVVLPLWQVKRGLCFPSADDIPSVTFHIWWPILMSANLNPRQIRRVHWSLIFSYVTVWFHDNQTVRLLLSILVMP